jgi:hypothetical protein
MMVRPTGKHTDPLAIPPTERLPEVRAGKKCICWGGPGLPDQPCTADTCNPTCRACAAAERPFFTREDLRFLETGTGPTADALRRSWATKDVPKGGPMAREREPRIVCGRGHPVEPGRNCKRCARELRRAGRTRAREGANA